MDNSADLHGRVTYRGYTLVQLTLGAWVVAALTGIPFATLSDAKRAIDRLCNAKNHLPNPKLPHGDSL